MGRVKMIMFKTQNSVLWIDLIHTVETMMINMFILHSAGWFDLVQRGQGQRFHRHRAHPGSSPLHLQYGVNFIMMMLETVESKASLLSWWFFFLSRCQSKIVNNWQFSNPHHLSSITVRVTIVIIMVFIINTTTIRYGPVTLKDNSDTSLSDNKYHTVWIRRPSRKVQVSWWWWWGGGGV